MRYSEGNVDVDANKLSGFFVGWPNPPSAQSLRTVLLGTPFNVLAWEGDAIVGFAYAISDGLLAAYIPLLEVRPERQREGIGSELVTRLLSMLGDIYMVDVVCDQSVVPFYERLGMVPLAGLAQRNYGAAVLAPDRR